MTSDDFQRELTELAIETAINRLAVRAILVALLTKAGRSQELDLGKILMSAIDAMTPQALQLKGMDVRIQTAALARLRERANGLLAEITQPVNFPIEKPPEQA